MKKYKVTVYTQVWNTYEVEAQSPADALEEGLALEEGTSLNDVDGEDLIGYTVWDEATDKSWSEDENPLGHWLDKTEPEEEEEE